MLSGVDYSDSTPDIAYVSDRMGRPTMISDGTGTHSLAYRPDGQTISASIPQVSGHSLGYGYDALGRRNALELHAPGSTLHATSYTYDGMSRLLTVGDGANLATYTRVPGTSLLDTTTINNGSTNVLTVDRDYDSLARLESISSSSSSVPSVVKSFSYVYNDRDQRTKCTLADGSYWEYSYDDLGQVTSGIKKSADGTPIPGQSFGYLFDDIGNRKSATSDLSITSNYSHNLLNQYTQRTIPGIIPVVGTAATDAIVKIHRKSLGDGAAAFIDPERTSNFFHENLTVDNSSGPVTEEIDVYCHKEIPADGENDAQEIAAKVSRTVTVPKSPQGFAYDADGNLTSDGTWNYVWDAENRLTSVESVSSVSNRTRVEFEYDYLGRRVAKKTYSWDTDHWSLITDHRFAWDGWNLVAIFNASNELQRSFCWAGLGDLVADTDHIAGKSYLPIYDGNKNIHGYVDAADGSLVSEYDFDPFGRIVQQSGTGDFPFRFASYFYDTETGMVYYGYRYYSPEMGRWVNRDMIAEVGGLNLYGTSNDFVNMFDILGMWTEPDRKGGNWAIICSDKNDDTIHSLANKIHLEEKQALGGAGWLRDKDGKELPVGTIIGRKAYSIPNVVTVYTSRPQFGSLWRLKGINPFTEDAWLMIVTTLRQKAVARGMDYERPTGVIHM